MDERGYLMASELISQLGALMAAHGDLPVAYWSCEYDCQEFQVAWVENGYLSSGDRNGPIIHLGQFGNSALAVAPPVQNDPPIDRQS